MRKFSSFVIVSLALSGALWAQADPDPTFTISLGQLTAWVADLPPNIAGPILAHPREFLEDYKPLLALPWDQMVLVDKGHALPETYAPRDLVRLNRYGLYTSRPTEEMRKEIVPILLEMSRSARKDGVRLEFSSCYRSWAYQRYLFQHYVNEDGLATAERYSARPGQSQHQLGLAADFGSITPEFAKSAEGKWMDAHAEEFGFSLSYPQGFENVTGYMWEPWHFRYIGKAACQVQKKWFGDIQQYLLVFNNEHAKELKASLVKS